MLAGVAMLLFMELVFSRTHLVALCRRVRKRRCLSFFGTRVYCGGLCLLIFSAWGGGWCDMSLRACWKKAGMRAWRDVPLRNNNLRGLS